MKATEFMYDKVKQAAGKNPDKAALVFCGKEISYSQLLKNISHTASAMHTLGINKNSTVTIMLPNIPQAVYAFYAANILGANISVVHPLLPPPVIFDAMRNTESNYLFLLDSAYSVFTDYSKQNKTGIPENNIVPCTTSCGNIFMDNPAQNTEVVLDATGTPGNIYMHSGGTTDKSKTIHLSNYAFNELAKAGTYIYSSEDCSWLRTMMILPMFHGFGLGNCMHTALSWGGTLILIPRFTPAETIETISSQRANVLIGVPAIFEKLGAEMKTNEATKTYDLSNLRNIFSGGDIMPAKTEKSFNEEIAARGAKTCVRIGYGLTECVASSVVNTNVYNCPGSVGHPLPNVRLKIVDENGIDSDTEGEICISGTTLMEGYHNDSKTNNAQFFTDNDGVRWLKTGDYGHINGDGYLFFKQRIKRMLKYGNGLNIFPVEIEECALNSGLAGAAAATQTQDGVLTLFFVPAASGSEEETIEKLKDFCTKNLPYWSVPKRFVVKPAFPLTPYNKVDYNTLAKE